MPKKGENSPSSNITVPLLEELSDKNQDNIAVIAIFSNLQLLLTNRSIMGTKQILVVLTFILKNTATS